jgi:hypothetical protein
MVTEKSIPFCQTIGLEFMIDLKDMGMRGSK